MAKTARKLLKVQKAKSKAAKTTRRTGRVAKGSKTASLKKTRKIGKPKLRPTTPTQKQHAVLKCSAMCGQWYHVLLSNKVRTDDAQLAQKLRRQPCPSCKKQNAKQNRNKGSAT